MHVGVSYGEMKIALLGGHNDEWVYLLNGECVSQLSGCIEDAGSQEVVATKACFQHATLSLSPVDKRSLGYLGSFHSFHNNVVDKSTCLSYRKTEKSTNVIIEFVDQDEMDVNQSFRLEHGQKFRLTSSVRLISTNSTKVVAEEIVGRVKCMRKSISQFSLSDTGRSRSSGLIYDDKVIKAAGKFVPRPVLKAIYSDTLSLIGELRQVTTMFMSIDTYSPVKNRDPCSLQPFFKMAQEVLHESGGFLRQFLVDDKGCVLIALWGIPTFTHANNCYRALYCGSSILRNSGLYGHSVSIGITTGNVYCGVIGSIERRDYAGIGTDVNMAARLMCKAHGRLLLDQQTYQNLSKSVKDMLVPGEELIVKGSDVPLKPYVFPSDCVLTISDGTYDHTESQNILKKSLKAKLTVLVDQIADANSSSESDIKTVICTLLTGGPGTGKSTAMDFFRQSIYKRKLPVIYVSARADLENEPYGLIRVLLIELIGIQYFTSSLQQRKHLKSLLYIAYPDKEEEDIEKSLKYLDIVFGVESNQVFQDAKSETNDGKIDYEIKFPMIRSELSSTNLVFNDQKKVIRPINDRTVYDLFASLVRNQKTVVIIENAQHCDELSWNELLLLIAGTSMDLSILMTLKSSTSTSQTENKRIYSFNNLNNAESFSTLDRSASKRRISVLRDAILLHKQPISSKQIDRTTSRDLSLDLTTIEIAPDASTTIPMPSNSPALKGTMKYQSTPSFQSIYRHERSVVIDMSGLNRNEVEEVLLEKLNIDTISSEIIDLVLQVSSGNAYWCNVVADFIKERGVKELEDALEKKENVLRHLIILRMENLESDYQLVLKYASVVGEEFSEMMLLAVLPPHLSQVLPDYLDTLAENGFVSCIEEFPELIYGFQNDLIRETLSGLLPIK